MNEAINACQKAASIAKNYQMPWYNLGNVYSHLKHFDEAASAYKQSVEIDDNYYPAWVNLGNVYHLSGKPHEAQNAYKKALDINGNVYEAWSGLGNTMKQLGRNKEDNKAAIEAYQKALDIDANAHEVWSNLSFIYYQMECYEDALEPSRNAQRLASQNPLYWAMLGLVLSHLEQEEESIQWLCQAWKKREVLQIISTQDLEEALDRIGFTSYNCR